MSSNYVVIPAAGTGTRMQLGTPKQYYKLSNGKTILDNTLSRFIDDNFFDQIIVVISSHDNLWSSSIYYNHPKINTCIGASTRFTSVLNALKEINNCNDDWIFVHDAVRPFIDIHDIINLYNQVIKADSKSGFLAIKALETVKEASLDNIVKKTINRDSVWLAQTPQLSKLGQLKDAFDYCYSSNLTSKVTDEASALELFGIHSIIVEGSRKNIKITTKDDLDFANWQINR